MTYNLIGVGNNAKTIKGDGSEYMTAIMYLKPEKTVYKGKIRNLCPMADKAGCGPLCLNTAGRGVMSNVQAGRLRKTELLFEDREKFLSLLKTDITVFSRRTMNNAIQPCVRLDGTSDNQWERFGIMEQFPAVQFYDYTKIVKRAYKKLPDNYHITLSYSEANPEYADEVRQAVDDTGVNMAVVFGVKSADDFPATFRGLPVINGDKDDLRFLDPTHCVVGLVAKGKAKVRLGKLSEPYDIRNDTSGFVVHPNEDGTWGRLA